MGDPELRGTNEKARTLASLGIEWELLGEEVVGFGAVAWLSMTPSAESLAMRESSKALKIEESGRVPEVLLENPTGDPLLVLAHAVFTGGLQTRALERSVILRPNTKTKVPVHCVEAGRWRPREGDGARLEVAQRTAVRTRVTTSVNMAEHLTLTGAFTAEQQAVWAHIDDELRRSAIASGTRSYEAYLQGVKSRHVEEAKNAAIKPPPRANAMMVFPKRGGYWLEGFASSAALAEQADDLLSDLFDPTPEDAEPASRLALSEVLPRLLAQPITHVDAVDGTLGVAHALTGRDRGAVLTFDGALAHLAIGAAPPAEQGRPAAAPVSKSGVVAGHPGSGVVERARPRLPVTALRDALARASDLMEGEPPEQEDVSGYRLVRVSSGSLAWVDVHAEGDGYAVIGSHERCDVVLGDDDAIWLRHLLTTCVRTPDGVGLRLMDLKTTQPFFFESDDPLYSVIVTGTFALRLGRHVVCGFPIATPRANGAPPSPSSRGRAGGGADQGNPPPPAIPPSLESAPPPVVRPPGARGPNQANSPYRRAGRSGTMTPCQPISQIQDMLTPSAAPDQYRVTLERSGMGASIELPASALEAGILLGRATNCYDGGLRRIFCEAVSRAHVILIKQGKEVAALDLCTTNGTRVNGKRIRRYVLPDSGATLDLAKKVTLRWHRRRGP